MPRLLLLLAATAAVYGALLLLTEAVFLGDAPDYAWQVTAHLVGRTCEYLDIGHLLWRPLGAWAYGISGRALAGPTYDTSLAVLQQLAVLARIAGLITALAASAWLWLRTQSWPAAVFGAGVLLFSQVFLNYAQAGTSYIAALAGLMLALVALAPSTQQPLAPARCVLGGLCLAASVLFWLPFVLAVPATVASIYVLDPRARHPWRDMALTAATFSVATTGAAFVAGRSLGFTSASDYRAWVTGSGHGIVAIRGISRAVIGLPRSFVDLGDLGQLVKRFLLHDSAGPVAVHELFTVPLALLAGFYLAALLAIVLALRSSAGRRALVLLALLAVPVIAFAVSWSGGDLERYLALTPGVTLVAAEAYRNAASKRTRALLAACPAILLVANLALLAVPRVARAQAPALARLHGLPPSASTRLLIVSHAHDAVAEFHRNHPLHPANRAALRVLPLVVPGMPSVADWRRDFEREVVAAWNAGRTVWVSERLLDPSPRADANWVEGDPASLPWTRLHEVFARLQYGARAGAAGDGFVTLPPSPHNWEVFAEVKPEPWLDPAPRGCDLPESIPG